jgi:Fur family transcriptional regulator, ferric uptake regulator
VTIARPSPEPQKHLTTKQATILGLLEQLEESVSAQMLYTLLRQQGLSLGLATVYRSLETLKLRGLVQSRTTGSGEALYSLVQHDRHYVTCLHCGKSIPLMGCPIQSLESQLQQVLPFKIYYHTLEFFGSCSPCSEALQAEP